MPISRRTLLPFALTLGLGACAVNTPVLDYAYVSDNYAPYLLGYAAKQGGMPTEVTGNPFPAPTKAALDREVAESLTENHFGPEMNFVTAPLDASASCSIRRPMPTVPSSAAAMSGRRSPTARASACWPPSAPPISGSTRWAVRSAAPPVRKILPSRS